MKNKKIWRLPNGDETTNVNKMVKAWADIYKPFCKVTGASIIGYDPGFLFSYQNMSFDLPTSIVEKITKMIKALGYCANHGRPSIIQDVAKEALILPAKPKPMKKMVWKLKK